MYTFNASVTGITSKILWRTIMANAPVQASGAPALPDAPIRPQGLYKAFAASLTGTALEWYDFAVYSAAAARRIPYRLLPVVGSPNRHHPGLLDLRGRLHFPPRGWHRLRPSRRSHRAQEGPCRDPDDHRRSDRSDRRAARLRHHRHRGPDHSGAAPLRTGCGRRRRMGRGRPAFQRVRRSAPPRILGFCRPGRSARR